MTTHEITYEGTNQFFVIFVHFLADAGVEVDLPPERLTESRGAVEEAHVLLQQLVAAGAIDVIRRTAIRFKKRWPRARITIDGVEVDANDDEPGDLSDGSE